MKHSVFTFLFICLCSSSAFAQGTFVKADEPAGNRLYKTEADRTKGGSTYTPISKAIVPNASTPAPLMTLLPDLKGGVDPMIAVGERFMIVTQDHAIEYFDKSGKPLTHTVTRDTIIAGHHTTYTGLDTFRKSATDFFQPVIDKANENEFSYLQGTPHVVMQRCNKTPGGLPDSDNILNEAYDTRVIYEPHNKRFIILSALRNSVWIPDGSSGYPSNAPKSLCQIFAMRTFVFAISKTDDPRDGFHRWYWTKNNYRDWPRISADKDVFTIAHNGAGQSNVTTPSIYVISLKDMIAGKKQLRYFTYFDDDGPARVVPVAMYKTYTSKYDNLVMYLVGDGDNADLYYFRKSANMWTEKPELEETDVDLDRDVDLSWHERPVFRKGILYFTSNKMTAGAIANKRPRAYGFTIYRLPLSYNDGDIEFNDGSSKMLTYNVFPPAASGAKFTSYEVPCMSVNENGTMLVAYGRLGKISVGHFIKPESRYFEFLETEKKHRDSHVLKAGQSTPMDMPDKWNRSVIDGFINEDYSSGDINIDYATVVPDPSDSRVFWIAHSYANRSKSYLQMVVGKVKAAK